MLQCMAWLQIQKQYRYIRFENGGDVRYPRQRRRDMLVPTGFYIVAI